MKRFLFILLCGALTLSCAASTATSLPVKGNVEKVTEDKSVADDIASKAKTVIDKWANDKDEFTHTKSAPYILEKKVTKSQDALNITFMNLLSQSADFKAINNASKTYKYDVGQLKVYYTEYTKDTKNTDCTDCKTGDIVASAIVIFEQSGKPDTYILVFKK